MKETKDTITDWNKPLSKTQIQSVIYNVFCTIIFFMPIIPERIGMGIYSLKNTLFNILVITTTISLLIVNNKKTKLNIYTVLAGIYLLFAVLSSIFSNYGIVECVLGENGRGEGLMTIFSYIATFIICMKGYPHIIKNYNVGIIAALIVSTYGIIQANVSLDVKLPFGVANSLGVAEGTMGNQNFFSSYLCLFLPMLCYHFFNNKSYRIIVEIAMLFTALVFAKTLSGYMVFLVMLVVVCVFSYINAKNKRAMFCAIAIVLSIIVGVFGVITYIKGDAYANELISTKQEVVHLIKKNENFGTNRLAIWKRVGLAINNNKLLGVGPDSLLYEFKDKQYHIAGNKDILNCVNVDKAHSEYLQIAVTTGIPSLVVYMCLISCICVRLFKVVIKSIKQKTDNKNNEYIIMTLIAIISYLAQAIGNISVVQVAPIFWTMLGIGAGITLNEKR